MLHPSYTELMEKINKEGEQGEEPVINSRYSIVMATAKRARQSIARQSKGDLDVPVISKPLSRAVEELADGELKVLPEKKEEDEG